MAVEHHNVSNITRYYYSEGYEFDYESAYEEYKKHIPKHTGKIVYLSIIFMVSLIFNIALIIQQIYKIRKPKIGHSKSMPYMLVTLAVGNLISTVFTILVQDIWFGLHWWYAGDFMCKIVMYFRTLEHFLRPFSAVGLLMAYIAERVTKQDGRKIAVFFMIPACVLGCLLSSLSFFIFGTHQHWVADKYYCTMTSRNHVLMIIHGISAVLFGFVCPAVISASLCCTSCCIDRKDKSKRGEKSSSIIYKSTTEEVLHDRAPLDNTDHVPVDIKPNYLPLIINIVFFVMYLHFLVLMMIAILADLNVISHRNIRVTTDHVLWMYFVGVSSIAVTAVIAVVGSLSKFPKFNSTSDFRFKKLMADIY